MLAVLVALGTGCNNTPKRPPPPPKPREVRAVEPPPAPLQTRQPAQGAVTPDAAATSAGEYAPPSANAAEVEIEEIAVDGAPVQPASRAAAAQPAADSPAQSAGGAPASAYATPDPSSEVDEAGVVILNSGTAPADPDMVGPNIQLGGQTTGERVQALDTELNNQLSAFDERMRRARQAAASEHAERARGGGSTEGANDGRGQRRTAVDQQRGAGGASARASGAGNTPDLSGTERGSGRVATYQPPAGVADGRDDDIVARQLREAATTESDPVLREKLWDEYRRYKTGL